MLKETQLFQTVDRVAMAVERLQAFEPPEGYWLAFSGGKDSITIKRLADMAGVAYEAHYNVTTIDPPELCYYIREHHPNVKWDHPEKPFLRRLVEKGFPLRQRRWCCHEYKESGGAGRRVVTGIRAAESHKRSGRRIVETCYRDTSRTFVNPILDWSDADVWEFIRAERLPFCSLYDEGFRRIGCILCPMAYRRWEEAQRWPGYIRAFRRAFDRLYERAKHRKAWQRWASGQEAFEWWVTEPRKRKEHPDQTVIFE